MAVEYPPMGFSCGIVGLPNVGKSTIFNALTSANAAAANYPFCTIEPNTGVVKVPDPRLDLIIPLIASEQIIPATMHFTDIAGLVKGASKGEGLGNAFLGHIRETNAIAHVVRCFDDPNIIHVANSVDPIRDIEVIDTELMLADLESVTKKYPTIEKMATVAGNKEAQALFAVLKRVREALDAGKPVRSLGLDPHELEVIKDYHFITVKRVMYIANVNDADGKNPENNPHVRKVMEHAKKEGSPVVPICGKVESEIAELTAEEKKEFLKDYGLEEPGLNKVIRAGYSLLGLETFFTVGPKEIRAWTIHKGDRAPQAAGVIHTDFEKGFIRAEIYHCDDLFKHKTEAAVKDAGLLRQEGKDYVMKDGDVVHFKFNV